MKQIFGIFFSFDKNIKIFVQKKTILETLLLYFVEQIS